MARKTSKKNEKKDVEKKNVASEKNKVLEEQGKKPTKTKKEKEKRVRLHKSFRRSYREDYQRELEVPGIMSQIFLTFKTILKNWKLFLPFLVILVLMNIVCVGMMNEDTYTSLQETIDEAGGTKLGSLAKAGILLASSIVSGGIAGGINESTVVFLIVMFLILWLTTIYLLRHILAEQKIRLRDALYNSMSPLISTFIVLVIVALECIPIIILVIAYSSAIETQFLATPFYALVFFIFACLMIILSAYLLSGSLIALIAISAPGLEPIRALKASSDLIAGRRIKFIIRLIAMIIAVIIMWLIIMLPLILIDGWVKSFEWTKGIPFIPICLNVMIYFTGIFITTYLYIYYKWLLNYEEE